MKNIYSLLIMLVAAFGLNNVHAQRPLEHLNANMVDAGFGIGGNLFSKTDSSPFIYNPPLSSILRTDSFDLYEVPKGTNKRDVYYSSLWMTGLDSNGNRHCAAQIEGGPSGWGGSEYYDGPIVATSDAGYDAYYQRVFKVTRSQIDSFQTLIFPVPASSIDSSILLWPGLGNTFVEESFGEHIASALAPFVDANHNGIYDPVNGDYPFICGDQAVFFVFNDVRGPHYLTAPDLNIGMEIHGMAYEFIDSTSLSFAYPKRAINNTVFVHYSIENKSSFNYDSFYLALYLDPDIGCFSNDRVGCDTVRNMIFAYNGTTPDLDCTSETGTYPYQEALGVIMLNDTMNSFIYFTDGALGGLSDPTIPSGCEAWAEYMQGFWADSTTFTYGGTGYGGRIPTKYIFPGDPNDTSQWSEMSVSSMLQPGDRRMAGAIGPMNFAAGETKQFDFAFTTAYDSTATFVSIVDTLKRDADIVQQFYYDVASNCSNRLGLLATNIQPLNTSENFTASLFPNPANNVIKIEASADISLIQVMDITGRAVIKQPCNKSSATIDVSKLVKGIYLVNIKCGDKAVVKKLVVE